MEYAELKKMKVSIREHILEVLEKRPYTIKEMQSTFGQHIPHGVTLSNNMRKLVDEGIVVKQQLGHKVFYALKEKIAHA